MKKIFFISTASLMALSLAVECMVKDEDHQSQIDPIEHYCDIWKDYMPQMLESEDLKKNPKIYHLCIQPSCAPYLKKMLEKKLVHPDYRVFNASGFIPLIIIATAAQAQENIEVLLEAKADPNVSGPNPNAVLSTCTPVSLAIELKRPDLLQKLLIKGALVDLQDDLISLPLNQAIDQIGFSNPRDYPKILQIITLLLKNGADPYKRYLRGSHLANAKGSYVVHTAYDLAEARNYTDVLALLKRYT